MTEELFSKEPNASPENAAWCSDCDRYYPVETCPSFQESESWELSATYTVHQCPLCPDGGCVEDYACLPPVALSWVRLRLKWLLLVQWVKEYLRQKAWGGPRR